jgi:YidC/Oxa1 family membrane protein insertase
MQKNKNTILFVVLSALILFGWLGLNRVLFPPREVPPPPPDPVAVGAAATLVGGAGGETPGALGLGNATRLLAVTAATRPASEAKPPVAAHKPPAEQTPEQPAQPPPVVKAEPEPPLRSFTLGNGTDYFLKVVVDSRGAAVRSVTLRDFQQVDEIGRPMWLDDEHTRPKPLELVQESKNRDEGSVLLYAADPSYPELDAPRNRPHVTLGKVHWKVVEEGKAEDGATFNKVAFQTDAGDVRITKIYTLRPTDYHVGLEVKLERKPGVPADKKVLFRYHLTTPHGLPIEGEWYTNTLRNAVIGRVKDNGAAERDLQALRTLSLKEGGDPVQVNERDPDHPTANRPLQYMQYAGVAVQYFSSLVVVDESQVQDWNLFRARPTIESAVLRGQVVADMLPDSKTFDVLTKEGTKLTVRWPRRDGQDDVQVFPSQHLLSAGERVAVVYRRDELYNRVAQTIYTGDESDKLLFDDINVDLVSNVIDLKADAGPEVHKYLLYNGPAKVRMLDYLEDAKRPSPALVDRYADTLHLVTVTDYPSQWFGSWISQSIGWSSLLIWCTNKMHWVLWALHHYLLPWSWSWGLCILLLTVLVRGAMFPLSRRQALTSVKMQALAPEIKKLQEKYKDDRQALGMAQMELYRKHGVNPIGSCWTIFLQMPIFLGLYYALQESLNFRLAPFPLLPWIHNLAAPDMLFKWGEWIPWISRPDSYGGFLYLGPFFNLLPVIVAGFMFVQQKMMTPPPTDEQQEMQQKMMKFMTVFFAIMFYKLAAGLCLYFIASSVWGFTERKLLPKRKTGDMPPPPPEQTKPSLFQRAFDQFQALARPKQPTSTAITATPPAPAPAETAVQATPPAGGQGKRKSKKKRREERNRRRAEAGSSNGPALTGGRPTSGPARSSNGSGDGVQAWWGERVRRLRAWWVRLLRSAEKR